MELILKYFPDLTERQKSQFAQLENLYKEWNNKINVISRKDIDNIYLLVWTTTPWTLPSNTALAVGKKITYVKVKTFNTYTSESITIVMAKDLLHKYFTDGISLENYKEGMELTSKQLTSVFEKLNIKEIDPKGEVFDPNFHEAMTMVESDQDANTVISVMQKGYTLNERVLRPALVTVAKEKN